MASRPTVHTRRRRHDADSMSARVPFDTLRRYVAGRMGYPLASLDWKPGEDGAFTTGVLAGWLGVTQDAVAAWQRKGSMPVYIADKLAVSMRVHPFVVWGDDWLTAGAEQMEVDNAFFDRNPTRETRPAAAA